ncbi:MAG: DNA cytosine methyltransferase [Anaerolineae bacterium]|nr:DNA cytosine methyltransferase [Anaerolineae bacterium]
MIYGSICSGIEAASVAWHPLGWRAAFVSEIEPFPRTVLAHHYPDVPLHGDFTTIKAGQYAAIDVLVGGTPCQSFSIAGLRGGLGDERGNLALEYLRLAQRLRPKWLVWENVPGVLSSNEGRDFGAILGGMVELGYGIAYRVLDAQYVRVDGFKRAVPQRRRRVFVVGYFGDWRRAAAVLFERESLSGHPAPRRETGQGIAGTVTASACSCSADVDDGRDGRLIASEHDVAGSLVAKDGRGVHSDMSTFVAHALRADGLDASEDGTGRGTPLEQICFSSKDHGADAANGIAPTLQTQGGKAGRGYPAIAFNARQDPVVFCGHTGQLDTDGSTHAIMADWRVRRLTPRECERLQGFPDGYTNVLYKGKRAADGPRYKALGNSMAVNVMRWIGRRIEMVEGL